MNNVSDEEYNEIHKLFYKKDNLMKITIGIFYFLIFINIKNFV